uniref:Immediate early response 3-interacting protein 1 n=1 Tax=Calidris pygmaea TaxID=425635 RepID=A0A8C3KJZ1_9CHAR
MAFTLYSLLQAALLVVNAVAVLHEERFLRHVGWGSDQGIGGFGEEPGIKAQLTNLIRSIRTVMRGKVTIFSLNNTVIKAQKENFTEVTLVLVFCLFYFIKELLFHRIT